MSAFAPHDSTGYRGEPEEAESKYRAVFSNEGNDEREQGFKLPKDDKDWM